MSLLPGKARAKHQKPIAELSWYWEPPESIVTLFNAVTFNSKRIHDPCCGSGRIPIVAREFGYEATGSDIVDRGFGQGGVDFFKDETHYPALVFNPPGGGRPDPWLATRFVMHALEHADEVAAIVPVPFQCSRWRRDNMFRVYIPSLILVLGDRPSMPPGGTSIPAKGGTADYCWIIWRRGHTGRIEWRTI